MNTKQLLVIGFTWPEPQATAAGRRMLQLLRFFLDEEYRITFASTASRSELSFDLTELGITEVPIALNDSGFDDFITELGPDIVLFDRFLTEEQFGWRVAEFAPQALRLLDTEDLHSLRLAREQAFKAKRDGNTDLWLQSDGSKRELASIFRSDLALVISSYEYRLLRKIGQVPEAQLLYLPFLIDVPEQVERDGHKTFAERQDFLCIGNGKHAPNVDAIVWLKTVIWPFIRQQLPEAQLHIYGGYLPQHILQFHKEEEGFLVHGWVENSARVMEEARVNLVPLRFGAGLKGKLVEAMGTGTPSVTTAVGAEGIWTPEEAPAQIANEAQAFAQMAIDLYRQEEPWHAAQVLGFKTLSTLFDAQTHRETLKTCLQTMEDDLVAHRTQNVVGQLLLHHTMASTKYMAKWIEAKRKR